MEIQSFVKDLLVQNNLVEDDDQVNLLSEYIGE